MYNNASKTQQVPQHLSRMSRKNVPILVHVTIEQQKNMENGSLAILVISDSPPVDRDTVHAIHPKSQRPCCLVCTACQNFDRAFALPWFSLWYAHAGYSEWQQTSIALVSVLALEFIFVLFLFPSPQVSIVSLQCMAPKYGNKRSELKKLF